MRSYLYHVKPFQVRLLWLFLIRFYQLITGYIYRILRSDFISFFFLMLKAMRNTILLFRSKFVLPHVPTLNNDYFAILFTSIIFISLWNNDYFSILFTSIIFISLWIIFIPLVIDFLSLWHLDPFFSQPFNQVISFYSTYSSFRSYQITFVEAVIFATIFNI